MNNDDRLPTEDEVEAEAQSGSTIFSRYFKIARCERIYFFTITFIFFFIAYIYSISREMKDAVVMERLDPASIPYLKMLVVLPVNIFVIFTTQTYLRNHSVSKVFSTVILIFLGYFIFYGLILLTFRDSIEMNPFVTRDWFIDKKMEYIGLEWFSAMALTFNSWTSSLLYLTAEIWSTLVLQFLFFCFANEVCTLKQSLRFTPLFIIFSNLGLIISDFSMKGIRFILDRSSYFFAEMFKRLIFVILSLCCLMVFLAHKYFEKNLRNKPLFVTSHRIKGRKQKNKIGLEDGFEILTTSKLIASISMCVIAYNIAINVVESSFKSCMNQYAMLKGTNVSEHVMSTQSDIQLAVGLLSTILLISPFPSLIRKKGFSYVAFACPFFCFFGILAVFGMAIYNINIKNSVNVTPVYLNKMLWVEQFLGVVTVTGFKLLKYAAFDISKEALSMKINSDYRARFKGIYDGICGKLGKGMGSGLTSGQNLLYNTNDVRESGISSLGIVTTLTIVWCFCVSYLFNKYNKSIDSNTDIDIDLFEGKTLE